MISCLKEHLYPPTKIEIVFKLSEIQSYREKYYNGKALIKEILLYRLQRYFKALLTTRSFPLHEEIRNYEKMIFDLKKEKYKEFGYYSFILLTFYQ